MILPKCRLTVGISISQKFSGTDDGLDKIELMKIYQLPGGGIAADLSPMPKSQLAIAPSQGHVSLMVQTEIILGYLGDFLN